MASSSVAMDALVPHVRRSQPDLFLCLLFAPPPQRADCFLLCAVQHELVRARRVASQPIIAQIRLQWWRDVLDGARPAHDVAGRLGAALDAGRLDAALLHAMIDGHEAELRAELPDIVAWRAMLADTQGGLLAACGQVLHAPPAALVALRDIGAAYGAGLGLRNARADARRGWCALPADILAAHGLAPETAASAAAGPAFGAVLRDLAGIARSWLPPWRRVPLPARAAALPAVLARRDLARFAQPWQPRGLPDRLAVLRAGLLRV